MNDLVALSVTPMDIVSRKLNRLLSESPQYGAVTLTVVFRAGTVVRVETEKKESQNFAASSLERVAEERI
ncbi:hypothetical protein AGMMS50212_10670 [Spirochaetia bacterium]|nr:hypothetical protein AGMMS50212_10670 [Spirochaetia bacterium]